MLSVVAPGPEYALEANLFVLKMMQENRNFLTTLLKSSEATTDV